MILTVVFGWNATQSRPIISPKETVLEKKVEELRIDINKLQNKLETISKAQDVVQLELRKQAADLSSSLQQLRTELKRRSRYTKKTFLIPGFRLLRVLYTFVRKYTLGQLQFNLCSV